MTLPQPSPTCKEFDDLEDRVAFNEKVIFKGNGRKSILTIVDGLESDVKSIKAMQAAILVSLIANFIYGIVK